MTTRHLLQELSVNLRKKVGCPPDAKATREIVKASGAEILYSEDLSDGQAYGAVRVVNPLRAACE